MAWQLRHPRLLRWVASQELGQEVAEQVAENDKHGDVASPSKVAIDPVYSQVQEQDGEFIAHQAEDVEFRGDADPQEPFLEYFRGKGSFVETHAVSGGYGNEGAIGNAQGKRDEGRIVVQAHGAVDKTAGVQPDRDKDDREDGADNARDNDFMATSGKVSRRVTRHGWAEDASFFPFLCSSFFLPFLIFPKKEFETKESLAGWI